MGIHKSLYMPGSSKLLHWQDLLEEMNQTIKKHMNKLVLETQLPWTKCLPLVLLQIWSAPRKDAGVSLHEMLFGLPYLGKKNEILQFVTKGQKLYTQIVFLIIVPQDPRTVSTNTASGISDSSIRLGSGS